MTYDPHDSRLTAYALGELDEVERPEVEAQLQACAESRKAVEDIRALARLLTEQLHKEPSPGLAAAQRQTIEGQLAAPASSRRPMILGLTYLATAASALIAAGLGLWVLRPTARPPLAGGSRIVASRAPAAPDRGESVREFVRSQAPVLAKASDPRASSLARKPMFVKDSNSMYTSPANGPGTRRLDGRAGAGGGYGFGGMMSNWASGASAAPARGNDAAYYRSVSQPAAPASADPPPPQAEPFGDQPASGEMMSRGRIAGQGSSGSVGQRGAVPASTTLATSAPAPEPRFGREPTPAEQPPAKPAPMLPETEHLMETVTMVPTPPPGPPAQAGAVAAQNPNGAMDFTPKKVKAKDARNLDQLAVLQDQKAAAAEKPKQASDAQQAPQDKNPEPTAQEGQDPALVEPPSTQPLTIALAQRAAAPQGQVQPQGETYQKLLDNLFLKTTEKPLSTFSIDVDTASYANVRRFLRQGQMPPVDAVRIEEMINYFPYDDPPPPQGDEPFSVRVEIAGCPWTPQHRLARVALKGKEIDQAHRPPSNLVFLLDVSGSMADPNKLPLLKAAMRLLVDTLGENDRVAIVVYAGQSGLALPSTNGLQKAKILEAIDQLAAGGSTNGSAGIQLAYEQAVSHFIPGGINRVIWATDGDFNVGVTDESALIRMAEQKAKSGVFLSVLGFGEGNLKERTMEQMADKGNGNYHYIDSLDEARKVLVEQVGGTLVTIAKDVKIQVEFQPAQVARYRLIGYENRLMREEDFRDDTKDAGEIGAGHNVTAFYELVPAQPNRPLFAARAIRGAKEEAAAQAPAGRPSFTVFLRYKPPQGDTVKEIQRVAVDDGRPFLQASPDFQFAAAVAAFGMLLRDAPDRGRLTYDGVYELAAGSRGSDPSGYRSEFLELVRRAKAITRAP